MIDAIICLSLGYGLLAKQLREKTILMQLTDTEIRDINRYLAEGKPLPEIRDI
jgi:hypothetical protein